MEMAVYKCYEQEPKDYEIDRRDRIETYELKGKSRQFEIYDDCASIKVSRNYFYLKNDDVAKTAAEKHIDGDLLTITVWHDRCSRDFDTIVSVVNHTQNFKVVNHKFLRRIEIKAEEEIRHQRNHSVLKDAMRSGNHIFMLAKKVHNDNAYCYEFVDVCNEHQDGLDSRKNMANLFKRNGIINSGALEKTYLGLGKFNPIYGHDDYVLGIFRTTEKNQTCTHCGKHAWTDDGRNHSIIVGCGSYSEIYYCEYCFFDEMRIKISTNF